MARSAVKIGAVIISFSLCFLCFYYLDVKRIGEISILHNHWTRAKTNMRLENIATEVYFEDETSLNGSSLSQLKHASKRFQRRTDHMRRVCEKYKDENPSTRIDATRYRTEWVRNDNFVVVPGKSFLMCVLPKCGSTSWHWLARDMRDPLSIGHEFGWQDRQKNTEISQELDESVGKQLMINKDAFRGIAVRHPFAKLISGWNDKLANDITYSAFVLEAYPLMKQYASNKDKTHIITFEDLADYIATHGNDVKNLDYHFMPMQNLCMPCLYSYDYIIKLESLSIDEPWLKKVLNVSQMPWQQKGKSYFNENQTYPKEIIRSYFKTVKQSTIQKLLQIYYYDFALFGYTFNKETLRAGGFF